MQIEHLVSRGRRLGHGSGRSSKLVKYPLNILLQPITTHSNEAVRIQFTDIIHQLNNPIQQPITSTVEHL